MRVPQDNKNTSPGRKNYNRRRAGSANSRAVQTMTPQSSPSRLNSSTSTDNFQQSGSSPRELVAEIESMLATLRLRQVSDAKDDIHEKLLYMKNEVENIKENMKDLAGCTDMRDISQRIVRLESDMDEIKKTMMEVGQKVEHIESGVGTMENQLAEFSSMKAALASLYEQLQMLLNGGIMPDTFPMYPFDQPPPGV